VTGTGGALPLPPGALPDALDLRAPPPGGAAPSRHGAIRLSAPLIVRNEERFLPGCLRSIRDLVDEIVVVDTGSTDRTREIARDFGGRVVEVPWEDDFAAARNAALDLARGDWILYVDADERVRPCDAARVRAQLEEPSRVGYQVLLHPRPGFTPYWELRLFRNHPLIRFRGVIHENIWPGVQAYRLAFGGDIGRSDLVLDHEGYEGDQAHKHARNLPLLRVALRHDPSRVFAWCHLATIYAEQSDERRARAAWQRGLRHARRRRPPLPEDSLPYIGLVERRLARGREPGPLLAEALRRFPDNLQLLWLRGRAHMTARRFRQAIGWFERLVERGERGDYERTTAYDTRLFGLAAHEALAACHFKLGHWDRSRDYFDLALRAAPGSLEYRVKRALCEQLASASAPPPRRGRAGPGRAGPSGRGAPGARRAGGRPGS
jgi:tetratricopeptide (TPR) repeat protein